MDTPIFPFIVERSGDTALLAMDCGGVIRARHMPLNLLREVGELCRQLQDAATCVMPDDTEVPSYPGFLQLLEGGVDGACRATLGVHRAEEKGVECVIALYDEGDETAPVLVLVGPQIDEFLGRIQG